MFILFTNLFLTRPFRLENTLECYNLRGGQGGSTEVEVSPSKVRPLMPGTPTPKQSGNRRARDIESPSPDASPVRIVI